MYCYITNLFPHQKFKELSYVSELPRMVFKQFSPHNFLILVYYRTFAIFASWSCCLENSNYTCIKTYLKSHLVSPLCLVLYRFCTEQAYQSQFFWRLTLPRDSWQEQSPNEFTQLKCGVCRKFFWNAYILCGDVVPHFLPFRRDDHDVTRQGYVAFTGPTLLIRGIKFNRPAWKFYQFK